MVKIGLLLATHNDSDILEDCLASWIELKQILDIKISICHGMFKEYKDFGHEDSDKSSLEILHKLKLQKKIDYLYIQNNYSGQQIEYQNEAELRNHGLKFLLDNNIDYFWTIGADEFYTKQEILNIIKYIQSDSFIYWYSIHYKNYVFNKNSYVKGFCPSRIWKNNGRYKIDKFYWDDDIYFKDENDNLVDYKTLSSKAVPENLAFVKHHTWLNDKRSKDKIKYQSEHFKSGYGCSFKWDDKEGLIWNKEFFERTKHEIPIVYSDLV